MATLKNTVITDTGYLQLPVGSTADRPAAESGMLRYNNTTQQMEYYTNQWTPMTIPFQMREIITTAYTAGGYKDAVAWTNVNKTIAATDTTTNLGDGSMERSFNYQASGCSDTAMFVFGAANAHGTASNYIIAYNMISETQLTSGFSRTMSGNRFRAGAIFQEKRFAFVNGGGNAAIEQFDMATQTISNLGINYTADPAWAMSHENFGIFYTSLEAGGSEASNSFYFATKTLIARSESPGAHHQQKSLNSKASFCYAGNEGTYNGGNNFRRTNMFTNSTSGTIPKPITNSGEENFTLGQEHQYMIGMYNGVQNTISWRFNYSNETGYRGNASLEPKGKAGASSASCGWRA